MFEGIFLKLFLGTRFSVLTGTEVDYSPEIFDEQAFQERCKFFLELDHTTVNLARSHPKAYKPVKKMNFNAKNLDLRRSAKKS